MDHKMNRRQFLKAAIVTAGGVSLAACAPKDVPAVAQPTEAAAPTQAAEAPIAEAATPVLASPTPKPIKPVKVDLNWWGDNMADAMTAVAQKYTESHPGFEVTFFKGENTAYTLQLTEWFQSKSAPVILAGGGCEWDNCVRPGFLSSWDPYLELPNPYMGGKKWKDVLHMEWLKRARWSEDGKLYHMPVWGDQAGVYTNKKVTDELGLKDPQTWDEFIAYLQAIKDAGHDGAFQIGGNAVWLQAILADAIWRHKEVELARDPNFTSDDLDMTDSLNDFQVAFPANWEYCAYKAGVLDFTGEENRFLIEQIMRLKPFFPSSGAPQLGEWGNAEIDPLLLSFVNGDLISWYGAGWMLPALTKLTKDLPPEKQFEVGFFPIPGWSDKVITAPGYNFPLAPMRGSAGRDKTNGNFALYSGATEEERLQAVDFVMWMLSPESYKIMAEVTQVGGFPMITENLEQLPTYMQNSPKIGPAVLNHYYFVGSGGEEYYIKNAELFFDAATGKLSTEQYIQQENEVFKKSIAAWEKTKKDKGEWPVACS